jgi:CspA family cold shock protein
MLQALEVNHSRAERPKPVSAPEHSADEVELAPVTARVKWFDATRGFGFLVSDSLDGDILIHFTVLREHGRRSLPEGALVECIPARLERGLQATKVLSIDVGSGVAASRPPRSSDDKPARGALATNAGDFEPVEVKWFNRSKGYGFLFRRGSEGEDIFVHMETARTSGVGELQQGQSLEARIADGPKGLTAVELQLPS